jgi:long-chain acyl-CoA synthetase
MRYLITGGSRFDPAIATDLRAMGFEILQAYGLTETSGGATCTPPKHNVIGSVGRPLPGQELRIDNPQPGGDGKPAVGEICIRGPIVMKGYWNRSDATTAAIQGGWLHTGDLGYVDSGGNLFITGRKKEIIVLANGKNVYPEEIEDHYQRSPFIKEICVMGLSDPGQPASERLHAVIVPDWDLLRARKIVNAREVIRFDMDTLSAQLPATKRVLSYELWQEELPRTTTRKLKRFEIERMVREKRAAGTEAPETAPTRQFTEEDQQWLTEPEVARALDVVREASKLKKSDLHPKDSLELDLGLDSMERVELLVSLEAALGADVPDSVASEVYTVREMIDAVRAGATGSGSRAFEGWQAILSDTSEAPDVASFFKPHLPSKIFWFVMARMGYLLARDVFHLKVSGMEKLPKQGPYLICPNHQSFMDPPILAGTLPWPVFKQMFSVGTSEIFGNRFTLWIARTLHLYPVDPDANLIPAMKVGAAGLRHGEILLLYPEGERSIDGTPKSFKKGAAILAAHMGVPIYPVAMDGFFEAWPRNKRFIQKFADLKIRVGDPVYPPTDLSEPEKAYDAVIREVRRRVVEMWEQLHTGARPTQPPLQPPHTDVSASVSGNGGPGASRRPEQTLSSKR